MRTFRATLLLLTLFLLASLLTGCVVVSASFERLFKKIGDDPKTLNAGLRASQHARYFPRYRFAAFVGELKSDNAAKRVRGAQGLARIGHSARLAIPDLVEGLHDRDAKVATACMRALGRVGGEQAVPPLVELLDTIDPAVRWRAAAGIGCAWAGGDPKHFRNSMVRPKWTKESIDQAVEALAVAVDDPSKQVRSAAAFSLALMGPEAEAAVPALAYAASDPLSSVAKEAVFALGRIGVDADEAIQALNDYIDPPDPELREELVELYKKKKNDAVRYYVSMSLISIHTDRPQFSIPISEMLLQDGADGGVRRGASGYRHVERSRSVTPYITKELIENGEWQARRAAAMALGELGYTPSMSVREALQNAIDGDDDERVRSAAKTALAKVKDFKSKHRKF